MEFTNKWPLIEIIQSVYEAPAYHLILEAGLLILVFWLLICKSYLPKTEHLTEEEKEILINEWQPEPLVPKIDPDHFALKTKTVSSKIGKYIILDDKKCLNLASHNYLGLSGDSDIEAEAIKTLKKYGCGSCGPRAFFGTVDIHLELEKRLAKFLNVEETVLYSYGFSTVASAIPAYAKRGDIIFYDEKVNFSIQKGLIASRSQIISFKHNDLEDLESLLEKNAQNELENVKKAKITRKFLVVEALYIKTGLICPLKNIIQLIKKYKVRIFVDESYSLGVLGKTGRGIKEHFNIDGLDIDNINASLENAFASYGGFSAGTTFIVDHQRLSGLGYCFSASLPPLQASAVLVALNKLQESCELVEHLRKNCVLMHSLIKKYTYINLEGDEISPIKHLRFMCLEDNLTKSKRLENVVNYCFTKGYALTLARYHPEEFYLPEPSIRLIVNSLLTEQEIFSFVEIISKAFQIN